MKLPKLNQKGFGHVELLLIIVVIFAIVGVGYYTLKVRSGGIFNSQAEVSKAGSTASLANSNAEKTVAERDYTFELKKDNRAVANGATVSGPVVVGVNMNVDKNLTNVKFYVDGVEKGSKPGIGLTGFREFATWNTKFSTNGSHTITVKATGTSGKEFELSSSATNTKSINVTVDNGAATRAPTAGGSGTTSGTTTPAPTTPSTTPASSTKPVLTVVPGPLAGVAGSQKGTVDGSNVTGGIVFKVTLTRPKTEVYDLATMYVVLAKNGQQRITMGGLDYKPTIKEDGDQKTYTFERYYPTITQPNGSSTWQAIFTPKATVSEADKSSQPLVVNIQNTNSTAEATCKNLKDDVNSLFDRVAKQIDENQKRIGDVNSRVNARYNELNLAATNPIPDFGAKGSNAKRLSEVIETKRSELEAIKITCAGGTNVEDAGAKVAAFKVKLEETKAAVSAYRSATLDRLAELRSRLPNNNTGEIPTGFKKKETACYAFFVPESYDERAGGGNNVCGIASGFYINAPTSKTTFLSVGGVIAQPGDSLQQNTNAALAMISTTMSEPKFDAQQDATVDGQRAKKIQFTFEGIDAQDNKQGIVYVVKLPRSYRDNDLKVAGTIRFTTDGTFSNLQKTNIDKIVKSWEWK